MLSETPCLNYLKIIGYLLASRKLQCFKGKVTLDWELSSCSHVTRLNFSLASANTLKEFVLHLHIRSSRLQHHVLHTRNNQSQQFTLPHLSRPPHTHHISTNPRPARSICHCTSPGARGTSNHHTKVYRHSHSSCPTRLLQALAPTPNPTLNHLLSPRAHPPPPSPPQPSNQTTPTPPPTMPPRPTNPKASCPAASSPPP